MSQKLSAPLLREGTSQEVSVGGSTNPAELNGMAFSESEEHSDIRQAVRQTVSAFDDQYWRRCDEEHRFPWDFYDAMAKVAG